MGEYCNLVQDVRIQIVGVVLAERLPIPHMLHRKMNYFLRLQRETVGSNILLTFRSIAVALSTSKFLAEIIEKLTGMQY